MATGLKPGNQVTVKENLDFTSQSDAYKNGLKSVTAGEVGQVVGPAKGRSVIVEFNGVQVTVSSQRLQLVKKLPMSASGPGRPKRAGQANKATAMSKTEAAAPPAPTSGKVRLSGHAPAYCCLADLKVVPIFTSVRVL